jgi:3-hydroxybutyrate dehydrogenase
MFIGKTALVTGSTSGIGLGIAKALAAQGANMILNGVGDPVAIAHLCAELAEAHGVQVRHDRADTTRPDEIESMMSKALAEFGCVDLLINSAGIPPAIPQDDVHVEQRYAILAVNRLSVWHTTRLALPAMKRKGFGRIVHVAFAHARVASAYKSAYVTSKHGVAGFTKTEALEVAEAGITINAVCPGYVLRPLVEKQGPDAAWGLGATNETAVRGVLLAAQPTEKFVTAEQVAALASFLCSDDAASITGAILPMEGGWTAH